MSYITYCKTTSLGYQAVLKLWAIEKYHVSYTTKFAFNTIKNQIVNFCELEISGEFFSVLSWNYLIVNSKIPVHFHSYRAL